MTEACKKSYRKRLVRALCLIVSMSTVLTGCGFQGTPDQGTPETAVSRHSTISFSWWGNDERHIYTMDGMDLFQELNPQITVDCSYGIWNGFEKRNKVWMESCREADVMQINYAWLTEYSDDGDGYYDLYQVADIIDLNNFEESDLAYGEKNGKLTAIPIAFNASVMFLNENIYVQYGLDIPETWDDYFEAASVMKKDGVYPIGMVKKQLYLLLISWYEQSTGRRAFSREGELLMNAEDIAYILEFYKRLLDEKVLIPIDQYSTSLFTKGEIGGALFWISDANKYCGALEENGGKPVIGEYPVLEGAELTGWYMKPATMYAVSSVTEDPAASAELLNFLLNNKEMAVMQGTEKGVPVSKSALEALQEKNLLDGYGYNASQKMLEDRDLMEIMVPAMENEGIVDAFKKGADEYLYGKSSLEVCSEDILKAMTEIMQKTYSHQS